MANDLLKKVRKEAVCCVGSNISVTTEEFDEAKLLKVYNSIIQNQEDIELSKAKLAFEKKKFEREMALKEQQFEREMALKEQQFELDRDIRKAEVTLKETSLSIEKMKIESNERIANINAENDRKNRRMNYILGFTKLFTFSTMGAADMINTYIDDGRTPKLFSKCHDQTLK